MEIVSREAFAKLFVEAAEELDREVEIEVKNIIKKRMKQVTQKERELEILNDNEELLKDVNKYLAGEGIYRREYN